MATSSITKNFVISGEKQVEIFADAIEANKEITGAELLEQAWSVIEDMQYMGGGMVVFLEANNEEKLLSFYRDNKFRQFDTRQNQNKQNRTSWYSF